MFLTDTGFSSFETADPPSHVVTATRSIEACRSSAASLKTIAYRILRVAAVVGISLFLHGLALVVAQRAYAPYSVSRTGEYVDAAATANIEHRRLASATAPSRRSDRRR